MSETSTTQVPTASGPSGRTNVVLWVLQVLMALLFLWAGGTKVLADPMQVQGFKDLGLGLAGLYIVGVLEIAGAVGLLLPGVMGFAATCTVPLMIGATIATLAMGGVSAVVVVPLVTLLVVAYIAWSRRENTVAFVRLVLGR